MRTEPEADERRSAWDERHKAGDFEGRGPNPTLQAAVGDLKPGRALELACGSGTNAVWMASRGWRVTAVDWSRVGLENGRARARQAGVEVEWRQQDLFDWTPPVRAYDLVAIVYLHLPLDERRPVYARAAAAVASGGRLVIVGHDRSHAQTGIPGPDPDRLFTAAEIGAEMAAADPELHVERAEALRQPVPEPSPIDALLVVRRS